MKLTTKAPLLLGALFVAATFSSCTTEREVVVVHHRSYYHDGSSSGAPPSINGTSDNPGEFHAVEKPATYSQ